MYSYQKFYRLCPYEMKPTMHQLFVVWAICLWIQAVAAPASAFWEAKGEQEIFRGEGGKTFKKSPVLITLYKKMAFFLVSLKSGEGKLGEGARKNWGANDPLCSPLVPPLKMYINVKTSWDSHLPFVWVLYSSLYILFLQQISLDVLLVYRIQTRPRKQTI